MSGLEVKVAVQEEKLNHLLELYEEIKEKQEKQDAAMADFVALKNKGLGSLWILVTIAGTLGYLFTNWPKLKAIFS